MAQDTRVVVPVGFNPISGSKIINHTGGTLTVVYYMAEGATPATSWDVISQDTNYTIAFVTSVDNTVVRITLDIEPNTGTVVQECTFSLMKFTSGSTLPTIYRYRFSVDYDHSKVTQPIWQDVNFISDYTSRLDYTISDENNAIIYSGTAIAEPGTNEINFNINRICADYINSHLRKGLAPGIHYLYDYAKLFKINNGNNEELAKYRFYNSYAYEPLPVRIFLNDPIKRKMDGDKMIIEADNRQYTFVSAYNRREDPVSLTLSYDGVVNTLFELTDSAMFVRIGDGFVMPNTIYKPKTFICSTTEGVDGQLEFNAVDTCYEYCLYYVNAYGGWDSLLIKGNVMKTDNINSNLYTKGYNNTTLEFGKVKYLNEINTTYRLHTDWFNDDEQSRLHHLLGSNEVYLHNLVTGKIEPVIITNKTVEYKTYTNNGKKKWNNTIDVEVAQTKIRQ